MREKSKYLKMNWSTKRLILKLFIFSSTRVSDALHFLQDVKLFIPVFPLIFIVVTVLIRLWLFLMPGFVSANFQFELIVRDKFSSLPVLFLSFSFLFFFFLL